MASTSTLENDGPNRAGPYQLFMLVLCTLVLLALAAETFLRLDEAAVAILQYVDTGICVIFLIDFFVQLIRAESKPKFLKWGWIDFVSSIPMIGPLRLGRTARIVRILKLLRGIRSSKILISYLLERRAQSAFLATALVTIVFITFSSIFILHFETGPNSTIKTPGDALWWSFTTVTTVGYGDMYPNSAGGRIIAAVLMTAGVGLFGMFTGFVASWFIGAKRNDQSETSDDLRTELQTANSTLREADRQEP